MHSTIRKETGKLWSWSQGPLQFLKSQVYWKPTHTWALFVVSCHYRICGSCAAHTAKLAANIITMLPLPGRDPGFLKTTLQIRNSVPAEGTGRVKAPAQLWLCLRLNAGSHRKTSLEPAVSQRPVWTALCPLVPRHKHGFREIYSSGKRYTTAVSVLQHTVHVYHLLWALGWPIPCHVCAGEQLQVLKILIPSHTEFVLHSRQENGLANHWSLVKRTFNNQALTLAQHHHYCPFHLQSCSVGHGRDIWSMLYWGTNKIMNLAGIFWFNCILQLSWEDSQARQLNLYNVFKLLVLFNQQSKTQR